MNEETPRRVQLRQDLQQSWQQHQGKPYLVVQDPVARRYFRFTEQQAVIVELLADSLDVDTLAARASERLQGNLSVASAAAFCDSLETKDLLDTPAVHERLGTSTASAAKRRSSFLYRQVASFDPTALFDWAEPRTRWAFTPAFQVFGCFLIACGLGIFWLNWADLKAATPNLLSFQTILLVWPIVFSVSAFHEFCHGLTCRHHGGQVKEVGFMLIYFSPAFYCDVSDAWMFKSRRHRMAVTLAGGYGQLMLWGLCTIVWRLTDPSAAINHVVLVVVLFSGLQTLFNANPLIKLDGYYMLSDYLEVPNLRAKAFQSIGRWISRDPKRGTFRQERTLLLYGTCALVFSVTLLVTAYSAIYTWATERWATAGLVGFALFSTLTLRRTAVGSIAGLKSVASRASLVRKLVALFVFITLVLIAVFGRWELRIVADFQLVAQNEAFARPETDGVVTEVLVHEGDRVHKNDVLARTRDFGKQTEIEKITGELEQKRSTLDRLLAGARPEEIKQQQSRIVAKQQELENARRNQQQRERLEQVREQRVEQLSFLRKVEADQRAGVTEGVFPQIRLDEAENNVKVKEAEIREIDASLRVIQETADREADLHSKELVVLQSELTLMRAGNRPELIRETRAEIAKLETLLASLNKEVGRAEIRAPIDGIIVTEFPERNLNQKLTAGTNFLRLVDTASLVATISVPEVELEDVKIGNAVSMTTRSLTTQQFTGRVDFIAPVGREEHGIRVVTVRAKVSTEDPNLKPDTSGVARIHAGQRRIIDIVTRRARRWVKTEFWHLIP